jgi:predicted metal-dependent phosphoesterase TrpH
MLRVELHAHTADDPADLIPHSTSALIDRAAALGYDALAVTLHDRQLDLAPWRRQALERGIVLIPGVERTIQGRHVLLLNFPPAAERVDTFDALRALKRRFGGLVIAPHPFYPARTCVGGEMNRHADLFDAVEWTWFYTSGTRQFNDWAADWARAHGRPVVANADVHRLWQLGTTYSMVDSVPEPDVAFLTTFTACLVTSGPTPSPATTAISRLLAFMDVLELSVSLMDTTLLRRYDSQNALDCLIEAVAPVNAIAVFRLPLLCDFAQAAAVAAVRAMAVFWRPLVPANEAAGARALNIKVIPSNKATFLNVFSSFYWCLVRA